jgi:hypothetical protein
MIDIARLPAEICSTDRALLWKYETRNWTQPLRRAAGTRRPGTPLLCHGHGVQHARDLEDGWLDWLWEESEPNNLRRFEADLGPWSVASRERSPGEARGKETQRSRWDSTTIKEGDPNHGN